MNPHTNASGARARSIPFRLQKEKNEEMAPNEACPLFVASAMGTGKPAARSAGTVTRPPPPAIASTSPAPNAASTSRAIVQSSGGGTGAL